MLHMMDTSWLLLHLTIEVSRVGFGVLLICKFVTLRGWGSDTFCTFRLLDYLLLLVVSIEFSLSFFTRS